VILAFLIAPLVPALVGALVAGQIGWVLVLAPFAYLFALPGIPAFLLCRKLGWLKPWQIVGVSSVLGALVSPLLRPGVPFFSDVALFTGYAALTGLVFWLIAFARASSFGPRVEHHES
jgi:hypothetical protein